MHSSHVNKKKEERSEWHCDHRTHGIHQGSGMVKLLLALSVQQLLQPCLTFLRLSASLGPGLRLKFMNFWTCIMWMVYPCASCRGQGQISCTATTKELKSNNGRRVCVVCRATFGLKVVNKRFGPYSHVVRTSAYPSGRLEGSASACVQQRALMQGC